MHRFQEQLQQSTYSQVRTAAPVGFSILAMAPGGWSFPGQADWCRHVFATALRQAQEELAWTRRWRQLQPSVN